MSSTIHALTCCEGIPRRHGERRRLALVRDGRSLFGLLRRLHKFGRPSRHRAPGEIPRSSPEIHLRPLWPTEFYSVHDQPGGGRTGAARRRHGPSYRTYCGALDLRSLSFVAFATTSVVEKGGTLRTRAFVTAAVCAVVIGVSASAAFAGEVTGAGGDTAGPANANSICVFSGLNDDPDAPLVLDLSVAPNGPGGVAQSFGQDVTLGRDPHVLNPGDACRGGSNFARE
jgi:hypothetical protein